MEVHTGSVLIGDELEQKVDAGEVFDAKGKASLKLYSYDGAQITATYVDEVSR